MAKKKVSFRTHDDMTQWYLAIIIKPIFLGCKGISDYVSHALCIAFISTCSEMVLCTSLVSGNKKKKLKSTQPDETIPMHKKK